MTLQTDGPHFRIGSDADLGARPSGGDLDALGRLLELVRDDQLAVSFAALLSRPGSHHKTDDDRAWAVAVARVAREQSFPMWPVHLATYERVQPMAADDLIGP